MKQKDIEVMRNAVQHFERVQSMVVFDKQAQDAFEQSFQNISDDPNDVIVNFNKFVQRLDNSVPLNIVIAIAYAITKNLKLDGLTGGVSPYGDGADFTSGTTGSNIDFYKQLYERLIAAITQVSQRNVPAREAKTDEAETLFKKAATRLRTMPQVVTRPPGQNSPWNKNDYTGSESYPYNEDDTERTSGSTDPLNDDSNRESATFSKSFFGSSQNKAQTADSSRGQSPSQFTL